MSLRTLYFFTLLLAVLAFGPSFGHALEAANKLALDPQGYLVAQQLYQGWALLGLIILPSIVLTGFLVLALRRRGLSLAGALTALILQVWAQIVFWLFIWPANAATRQWTTLPPDWTALRAQWEYGHVVGALLNLGAVIALLLSLLAWARRKQAQPA